MAVESVIKVDLDNMTASVDYKFWSESYCKQRLKSWLKQSTGVIGGWHFEMYDDGSYDGIKKFNVYNPFFKNMKDI